MKTAPLFAALLVACSSVDLEETGGIDPGVPGAGGAANSAVATVSSTEASSSVASSSVMASSNVASSSVASSSEASSSSSGGSACAPPLLFGLADVGTQGQSATVDPLTGAITALGGFLPAFEGVTAAEYTYDPTLKRYYTVGGGLDTFDVVTGALLSTVPFPANVFPYRPAINNASELVAVYIDISTSDFHVGKIDPATGEIADLGPFPEQPGDAVADPALDVIYEICGGGIYTIDGASGAVLASTAVALNDEFTNAWLRADGSIIGLYHEAPATLDPATGAITPLSSSKCLLIVSYDTAYDPVCDRFYGLGTKLCTYELGDGTMTKGSSSSYGNFYHPVAVR